MGDYAPNSFRRRKCTEGLTNRKAAARCGERTVPEERRRVMELAGAGSHVPVIRRGAGINSLRRLRAASGQSITAPEPPPPSGELSGPRRPYSSPETAVHGRAEPAAGEAHIRPARPRGPRAPVAA